MEGEALLNSHKEIRGGDGCLARADESLAHWTVTTIGEEVATPWASLTAVNTKVYVPGSVKVWVNVAGGAEP
jgi:hypothetical protein